MTKKQEIILVAQADWNGSLVQVSSTAIRRLSVPVGGLKPMASGLPESWRARPEQAIAFLIALNSINYMFWSLGSVNGKKMLLRYSYQGTVGAMGMRAAFEAAWGNTLYPVNFRRDPITSGWVTRHFGDIPDPESRANLLSEVFERTHLEYVSQELYRRIQADKGISADDAHLLHQAFPQAFHDPYMKRSQLALFWIAGYFADCGIKVDTSGLTAFADYQVPRALRALGILEYSRDLAKKIDSQAILDAGSAEEKAIRSATIVACEALAEANGATAGEIDNFLWTNRNLAGATPFHLTFTEHY